MSLPTASEAAVREAVRAQIATMPIDKIVGKPSTTTVNHLKEQLAKTAAAVKTTKWGGRHGHLALVLTNAEYQTATGAATLADGTANNTDRQAAPPIVPAGLTNNMAISDRIRIMANHNLANHEFWKQEAIDSLLVERLVLQRLHLGQQLGGRVQLREQAK